MARSYETETNQEPRLESLDPEWRGFRIIGAVAALLAAIIFRRWLSAEFIMFRSSGIFNISFDPQPTTPVAWFALLQTHRLIAMLMLNAFDIVNYLLVGLMYYSIHSVLRKSNKVFMTFTMGITIAGIAMFLSSNQAFNLLSLSNQYAAAATESQRSLFLAAGQSALNLNNPTLFGTGLFWSYMCLYLAGLTISLIMLQTRYFGKATAVIGIVANAFGLGYFFTSAFAPSLGVIPAVGSAPCNLVWYILVGLRMFKLARKAV